MQLKKPFAVIEQVCDAETGTSQFEFTLDELFLHCLRIVFAGECKYVVKALVKRRILFNNRPRPIISCDL